MDLKPKDKIKLNPITSILESHANQLYEHPFVKKYCKIKIRTDFIRCGIIFNVILYAIFLLSLNIFAFELPPAWQVLSNQNSGANHTIGPFCETKVCRDTKTASFVFVGIRIFVTLVHLIHSRKSLTITDSNRSRTATDHGQTSDRHWAALFT